MEYGFVLSWIVTGSYVGALTIALFGWINGLVLKNQSLAKISGRILVGLLAYQFLKLSFAFGFLGLYAQLFGNPIGAIGAFVVVSGACIWCILRVVDEWTRKPEMPIVRK